MTQQLLGVAGSPFGYRGSIGPWPIDEALAVKLHRLGEVIAFRPPGLLGWFGVDYVLRDGDPWPVEVNPRYTASVEIHELASGQVFLGEHRHACEGGVVARERCSSRRARALSRNSSSMPRLIGRPLTSHSAATSGTDSFEITAIADVPGPGTRFTAGDPVMTLVACGENVAECQLRLTAWEREWMERLGFVAK